MPDLKEIFAAIREDCPPKVWSKGVELARGKHVIGLQVDDNEGKFRVELPDVRVAPEVSLFFDDEDWVCSCNDPEDPCSHVAAAVIALKRAQEQGESLPTGGNAATVCYDFEPRGDLLAFRRFLVSSDGNKSPFWGDLTGLAAGKKDGPRVATTDLDLQIDRVMADADAAELPPRKMAKVIKLLRGRDDVTLADGPINIGSETISLCLHLERVDDELQLKTKQDARVVMTYKNGVVMTAEALHPAGELELEPAQRKFVGRDIALRGQEVAEFLARDLPALKKQMTIIEETELGYEASNEKPYIYLESWKQSTMLSVRPLIAYGKPLQALVRGERFEVIGDQIPNRKLDSERVLRDEFSKSTGLELARTYEYEGARAVDFVDQMKHRYTLGGEGSDDFTVYGTLEPEVRMSDDRLSVDFSVRDKSISANQTFEAWQSGDGLVPLTGGGYAKIPKAWMDKYGARVQEIMSAQEQGAAPAAYAKDVADVCAEIGFETPDWLTGLRNRLSSDESKTEVLPQDFSGSLRKYQKTGFLWLKNLQNLGLGGLLCDDMGLGKTVQTIAALKWPALIVAPNSLLENWQNEITRFRPGVTVNVYHGPARKLTSDDVTITTYHTLRQDLADLSSKRWECAVFDEAQHVKNPDSQISQAAHQLKAKQKIGLTGTPIENRVDDLWSQMHLVMPGMLGSRQHFRKHTLPALRAGDQNVVERLKGRIQPFMLRRLKSEVAKDLPAKTEIVNRIELSEEQQALYAAVLAKIKSDLESSDGGVTQILTGLLRLRQICSHPGIFDTTQSHPAHAAKVNWLIEKLAELKESGNRSLLFSQWTSLLDRVEPELEKAGINFLRLDGTTKDRQQVVDQFSEGESDVLIMSLKAGGVGLNLTVADHVFLFDPWWNPAAESQAIDRAHRIGQSKPVFVHKLIALNTIEERVLAMQERKAELAEMFVGESMTESKLDRQELLSLVFDA